MEVVLLRLFVLVFEVPASSLAPDTSLPLVLLLSALLLPELLVPELLLPPDALLSPLFVPLAPEPELVLPLIVLLAELVVSAGVADTLELVPDAMLPVAEESVELVVVVLLPHDAINKPKTRPSILIFKNFIVLSFCFYPKPIKSVPKRIM